MPYTMAIHVDGACDQQNTKVGGWAVVFDHGQKVLSGYEFDTTNNRMELTAIRVALENADKNCSLDIRSDSEWAIKSIVGEYDAKSNMKLIDEIRALMTAHPRRVQFTHIPRNSEPDHARADRMAKNQLRVGQRKLDDQSKSDAPTGSQDE